MKLELSAGGHPARMAATRTLDIVVTSVSSDAHTWNLIYLQLLLEELGHRVRNLGACVPDDLIVEECRRLRPDLVVVSSVNGHGATDGLRVISALRRCPELASSPIVIGGKLDTAGGDGSVADRLIRAGFNGVFQDGTELAQFRRFVAALPAATAPQLMHAVGVA